MIGILNTFHQLAASGTAAVNSCGTGNCSVDLPMVGANNGSLTSILQIVFGIIGSVAVLIIVLAGLQLITSGGNPESAKKARETIIYAVAGLVIVVSAEIIVTFFLGKL